MSKSTNQHDSRTFVKGINIQLDVYTLPYFIAEKFTS